MRSLPTACAALMLASAGAVPRYVAADARDTAAHPACVEYHELTHPDSRTLEVRLANGCNRARSCRLSWTVTCGRSAHVQTAAATLAVSEERTWSASAHDCEDDWTIDTSWTCAPAQ